MRKLLHQLKLGLLGATLAILTMSSTAAFALPPQAQAHAEGSTSATPTTGKPADPGSQASSQAGTHLADAQLKSCQNREKAITTIISRINTRGNNQLNLFSTIADRVEAFKTSKNITVTNYDQLVAKLAADKTAATNDLAAMQGANNFSCTGNDPKGMVSAFQADLKTEISDLQTYRTDVKNLIVAVKTAIDGSASSSSSDSSSAPSTKANNNATTGGNQ